MIAFLEASLVRPLGLVVIAWLVLRVFRVQHPASRHAVWTTVLVGMLALPIISVVGPRWTLPVLPTRLASESQPVAVEQPPVPRLAETPMPSAVPEPVPLAPASTAFVWPSTETLVGGAYLTGLSVLLIYRILGWLLLRRVLARSRSLRPACLRESSDVVTPVAVGVWRPSVILPAGWREWNVRTRRAVLAHEFAHLRRRDTLVAALGRFVTSVLWFHPAAWWVSRQTSDLAELACDAVALERVGDPGGYSRVLVEFASAVNRSGVRIALPGLAIASGSRMDDRVDQVFLMSTGTMRRLARPRVWLAFGVPAMCLAATVMLGARAPQTPTPAQATPSQTRSALAAQAAADRAAGKSPTFDVVSIKPCPGLREPGPGRLGEPSGASISPGYLHFSCITLGELIDQSYTGAYVGADGPLLNVIGNGLIGDHARRVRGGPSWVQSDRFTIEARMRGDTTDLTSTSRFIYMRAALNPALRAMIEDRFQLKLHRSTEQVPMYALTVAKTGLKILETAPAKCWEQPVLARGEAATPPPGFEGTPACSFQTRRTRQRNGSQHLEITHGALKDFAVLLAGMMDRYVLDKTGLAGRYTFTLEYASDDHTPADRPDAAMLARFAANASAMGVQNPHALDSQKPSGDGPNIFKALEALGLKLEPTKGPAEYYQIDSVQKPRPNEALAMAIEPTTPAPSGPNAGPDQATGASTQQAAPALTPKFDVVSIKLCPGLDVVRPPGSGRGANPNAPQISPGYVHWDCVTLAGLIDQAWAGGGNGPSGNGLLNVLDRPREDSPKRVRGGPSWVHDERFTIEVKVSGDTTQLAGAARFVQVRDAMLPALRAMIEDRFQLKFRKATEQQSMYAMSVAKGGLKITQTAPQDCWRRPIGLGRGQVATPPPGFEGTPECGINVHGMVDRGVQQQEITHANLTDFARYLSNLMDRYVLDKTGVLGRFSFKFEYLPDDSTPGGRQVDLNPGFMIVNGVRVPEPPPPPARTDGKNIFKALEALGLHLEATKGPAEYLQIESVQRPKPNAPEAEK